MSPGLLGLVLGVALAESWSAGAQPATLALPARPDPKLLIEQGRLAEAEAVLDERIRRSPRDVEGHFLLGLAAIAAEKHGEAARHFQAALAFAPDEPRIRLELARALYNAGAHDRAAAQFQRALAGDLPPEVAANVRRFMQAIRMDRTWNYEFGFAIAPDTNINGGSSARETILFGLPFELGREARQTSGIGLAATGAVEYAPQLTDRSKLRLAAQARRLDYKGSRFDDSTLSLLAGPRFVAGNWDISLLATGFARWYGGSDYQRALGARVEATVFVSPTTALTGALAGHAIRYPGREAQDGWIGSANLGLGRSFGLSSFGSLQIEISRQQAKAKDLSNWSALASASYTRDLSGGYAISIHPALGLARYDSADFFFGRRRRDAAIELGATLTNRRLTFWRFHPSVTVTYVRRRSSIDLYDSTQNRVEFGMISAF